MCTNIGSICNGDTLLLSGTPVLSGLSECPCSGPWSLWWRQALGQLSQPDLHEKKSNSLPSLAPAQFKHSGSVSNSFSSNILNCRRIFANAHTYHINSISINSDQVISASFVCVGNSIFHRCLQETYLSADDLRINLWHMEITDQSFNIVDIKPANMEELTEVNIP